MNQQHHQIIAELGLGRYEDRDPWYFASGMRILRLPGSRGFDGDEPEDVILLKRTSHCDRWVEFEVVGGDVHRFRRGTHYPRMFRDEGVQSILDTKIESIIESEDLDCCDNFRVALKSDHREVAAYEYRRDQGCCGFRDEELVINGDVYLFGFNYGH